MVPGLSGSLTGKCCAVRLANSRWIRRLPSTIMFYVRVRPRQFSHGGGLEILTHHGQGSYWNKPAWPRVAAPQTPDEATLDRVANPHPGENYIARFTAPEFTALCPVTGQPDFALLVIDYLPGAGSSNRNP